MKSVLLLAVAGLLMSGCLARKIREEATAALACEGRIQLKENPEHEVWVANGCGKQVVCSLPDVEDAEVRCEGGAPVSLYLR